MQHYKTITTVKRYGWQKRAYIINAVVYVAVASFTLSRIYGGC